MWEKLTSRRAAWLLAGLCLGMLVRGAWPETPALAVATDSDEYGAIATGPLDDSLEGFFYLDFTTGELRGTALSPITRKFFANFRANVARDLGVDLRRNPRFLLTTGSALFRPGAGPVQPANAIVYVYELTSGKVAAYAVPWSQAQATTGAPIRNAALKLLDVKQLRVPEPPEE